MSMSLEDKLLTSYTYFILILNLYNKAKYSSYCCSNICKQHTLSFIIELT